VLPALPRYGVERPAADHFKGRACTATAQIAAPRFSSASIAGDASTLAMSSAWSSISNDGMIWRLAALGWRLAAYERGREHTDTVRTPDTS
jgi:hypothetical protein